MPADLTDLLPVLVVIPDSSASASIKKSSIGSYKSSITMIVLVLINLLNFMDRFTVAGVLDEIKESFKISDGLAGLLQTVFVISYMFFAPLFGYLGDRYSRRVIIIAGVSFWSLTTLAGSFVPNNLFALFAALRGLVGIGEASYSCVAPAIIADLYKDNKRSIMLAIFNIATPVGSGLGYIVGAYVAKAFGDWRWSLRMTPIFGAICVVLLIVLVTEPVRGSADGAHVTGKETNWFHDVIKILKVKSFVLTTLGFTWVAFALGALSWWAPRFLQLAHHIYYKTDPKTTDPTVSLIFGAITCVGGIVGVVAGSAFAGWYGKRNQRADPIVCGAAVLLAMPFLVMVAVFSSTKILGTWICIFFAEALLCSNWAVITDILMYVIVPERRSTATSIQIFTLHFLGDACSPYVVGLISDYFLKNPDDVVDSWRSLRNGVLLTPMVATLGGIAFLTAAFFIIQDRRNAEAIIESSKINAGFQLEETATA